MNQTIKNLPIFGIVGYVLSGVLISFFGPLQYVGYDKWSVGLYIVGFLVLFTLGFNIGITSALRFRPRFSVARRNEFLTKIFLVCCYISVVFLSLEFVQLVLTKGLNFSIAKSGQAYFDLYDDYVRNTGSYSLEFILGSVFAPCLFITTVWGVFYFRNLSFRERLMVIFCIAATVIVHTLGEGKQKQFGDLVVYFLTILLVKQASADKLKLKALLKLSVLGIGAVYVFLVILGHRYETIGISLSILDDKLHPLIYLKNDSLLISLLGDVAAFPMVMFSGYLGQGYYGLSLSMNQDFTWTAFAGSSYSVSVIVSRLFSLPFMVEQSYPYLVGADSGWAETKWHTVFAWMASDFTFPGTLILFFFVAIVYARAWREAISTQNPFAILLFSLLNVGIVYIPANNQLMHTPGALWTLILVFFLYFRYHKSYNDMMIPVGKMRLIATHHAQPRLV